MTLDDRMRAEALNMAIESANIHLFSQLLLAMHKGAAIAYDDLLSGKPPARICCSCGKCEGGTR